MRTLMIELLEKKVVLDAAALSVGAARRSFPCFMEEYLLQKCGNRNEAMLQIGGSVRGSQDHTEDAMSATLGMITGVTATTAKPFSARLGHLVVRVLMQLRHLQPNEAWRHGDFSQETLEVHEALSSLHDTSSTVELAFALSAYQQAMDAEGYHHNTKGSRLEDLAKQGLGAVEGPVPIDKILQFTCELYWKEEASEHGEMEAIFAKLGREDTTEVGTRQVQIISLDLGAPPLDRHLTVALFSPTAHWLPSLDPGT